MVPMGQQYWNIVSGLERVPPKRSCQEVSLAYIVRFKYITYRMEITDNFVGAASDTLNSSPIWDDLKEKYSVNAATAVRTLMRQFLPTQMEEQNR